MGFFFPIMFHPLPDFLNRLTLKKFTVCEWLNWNQTGMIKINYDKKSPKRVEMATLSLKSSKWKRAITLQHWNEIYTTINLTDILGVQTLVHKVFEELVEGFL